MGQASSRPRAWPRSCTCKPSRGIGEAIAYRYAQEGAKVVVSARTVDEGDHPLPGSINGAGAYRWSGPTIFDQPPPDLPEAIKEVLSTSEKGKEGPFASAALELHQFGLAPIPLGRDDGKVPLVRFAGLKRRPSPQTLAKWGKQHPHAQPCFT